MLTENLLHNLPNSPLAEERFDTLLKHGQIKLERIISTGHSTAEDRWYDQNQDEWILILRGGATLVLLEPDEKIDMNPGDHLLISAHRKHRVVSTAADQATVWLALHFGQ